MDMIDTYDVLELHKPNINTGRLGRTLLLQQNFHRFTHRTFSPAL